MTDTPENNEKTASDDTVSLHQKSCCRHGTSDSNCRHQEEKSEGCCQSKGEKSGCCSSEQKPECKCAIKKFFKWIFGCNPDKNRGQGKKDGCCNSHTDEKAANGQCCKDKKNEQK